MAKKINLEELQQTAQALKNYTDSNMAIRKLPVHSTTETDKAIIYYVNVMDLLKGVQYATFINPNDERSQQYRIVYVCDDDTVTNIVSLSLGTNINIVKAIHYTNYSNVVYNNIKYKVDYTNHSTSSDVIITKTLISYLPKNNRIEYEPTYEYNPATKKYVDDKFYQTGLMEEVGTIPCSEMQKCNNGTSRYVSSINFDELFSGYEDHVFYGIYDSDKLIRIRYDSTYNRLVTNELAISGTESIALGFDLGTHLMYPFNGGKSDVKAYTFTNDLVIKRVPVFDVNKAATKQYVDDSINSIPKQLVPLSTLIAEDTDGYAYLELNQFEKDKTYIILDDVSTNKFVYATSGIKFKLDGVLLSGAMLFLRTYFPYMTLGIKSSTNTLYFGDADSFWSYNLTNNSKEKNESYSLSMKANKSNVLEKNNTAEYIPTTDYNPATKKYVDDTAETLVAKDTNKYKLITCDDPLVIAKSDITDIADATITIDNLNGQFGNLTTNSDDTWTYTLNTIMTDVETFTFKVNNVEQKLVIVPYKEMQYDDSNSGITYGDGWNIEKNEKLYKGNAHKVTVMKDTPTMCRFTFTGTGFELLSKVDSNASIMTVMIYDSKDNLIDSIPCNTSNKENILYQIPIISVNNLNYDKYEIIVSISGITDQDGIYHESTIYIDSIRIFNSLSLNILNEKINSLYTIKENLNNILYTDRENAKFSPTRLYDPTTKKYVDDNIIRNYSKLEDTPIQVLPYTEKMNSITNSISKLSNIDVSTLEGYQTYMTVSDCYRLRLTYQKLDGTDIAFYTNYNTGNLIIQTKNKTDELIEILIDGVIYTATFKTATEEPKVEKNIRYLTNVNNIEYTPTNDYNPATKKYVDNSIENKLGEVVKKDTNKYKLITCDDPLVIAKSDITDIADATISIDNLNGQFGILVANDDGTYTYTLNTIMTDVETFTFKVNNVEQKLVIVPYREMQYDDSNGGITYDDNWVIEENSNHYNGKSHFTNTNGAEASFNFKGTGISILGKCEPNSAKSVIYLKNVSYTSMDTKLDYEIYQSNYYTRKNLSYNTYGIEFSAITVSAENRYNNYIDSIIVYDTLGTDLNDSIRKLYYGLDSSTGILRTDKENARFMPTRLYHPATKKYVDDVAETLVKKDTNKYKLITCDDPLVIAKSDITDLTDATIRISNLTGQFGNLVANADGTYTYTLNTIMTDVETFTFKVNNVEQKLVIVPYKEMTYDDKNAGITYEGNWYEDTNDNYYKKSSHYTKGTDNSLSKLSFIFTGTAVKFIGMTAKTLGTNRTLALIYKINNDVIDAEASCASISSNTITSTDSIMYNSCVGHVEFFNKIGFSKCKAELSLGKGITTYIDRIIIYNTIQNLNDSIESLYNQRESMPNVLRTDIPNGVFEPKELYDPATKYYVDKAINNNKVNMCTDEEITSMLTEVLGADYSATE